VTAIIRLGRSQWKATFVAAVGSRRYFELVLGLLLRPACDAPACSPPRSVCHVTSERYRLPVLPSFPTQLVGALSFGDSASNSLGAWRGRDARPRAPAVSLASTEGWLASRGRCTGIQASRSLRSVRSAGFRVSRHTSSTFQASFLPW
jgi:hypothetical protein